MFSLTPIYVDQTLFECFSLSFSFTANQVHSHVHFCILFILKIEVA